MIFTNLLYQGIFFCHIFFFLFVSISLFIILKVLHGLSYPWDATSMTIDNPNVKRKIKFLKGFPITRLLGTRRMSFARLWMPSLLKLKAERKTRQSQGRSQTEATLPWRFCLRLEGYHDMSMI